MVHSSVQHKHMGKLGRWTRKRQKASIGRGYKHGRVCGFRICGSEFENADACCADGVHRLPVKVVSGHGGREKQRRTADTRVTD